MILYFLLRVACATFSSGATVIVRAGIPLFAYDTCSRGSNGNISAELPVFSKIPTSVTVARDGSLIAYAFIL